MGFFDGMKTSRVDIKGKGYPKAKPTKRYNIKNVGAYKDREGKTRDLF